MDRRIGAVLGVIALIAIVVIVLATGGPSVSGSDASDDVTVEGEGRPPNSHLADVSGSEVRREGEEILFIADMTQPIPERVPNGSLDFRWDLTVDGSDAWIVSAQVTNDTIASVISQQTSYGSSTVDETMPGSVEVEGTKLTIRLRTGNIDSFPAAFGWRLRTTLDGDRSDPSSPQAHDQAPDSGPGSFE